MLLRITSDDNPAFSIIVLNGACNAFRIISTPANWSSFSIQLITRVFPYLANVIPPPGTIPYTTAFVAFNASSNRSFFSLISISEPAPILITATPPIILANRSCNFSLS